MFCKFLNIMRRFCVNIVLQVDFPHASKYEKRDLTRIVLVIGEYGINETK